MESNCTHKNVEKSNGNAQKTGMKRAVIYVSEHVGNWVIEDIEPIDQRVKKSRGQLIRITIKNLRRTRLEKRLYMIEITSDIPNY